MLLLAPIRTVVPHLEPGDVLLSGVRPVAAIAASWVWSTGGHAAGYEAFLASMTERFGPVEPVSCVFVIACLPRRLFEAYGELTDPELGYVEYRLPTLAAAVGLRLVDDERLPAWRPAAGPAGLRPGRRERFLSGSRRPIRFPAVLRERLRADGARAFHPYHGLYPVDRRWAALAPAWAARVGVRSARQALAARRSRRGGGVGAGQR
jgi:hypothetical protein